MMDHNHTHCQSLLAAISDYLDGDLDSELCLELERHMAECQNCRIVVDTLRKTISLYHGIAVDDKIPPLVRERLFRTLQLEDFLS